MTLVLDSSVTLAWFFEDETTPLIESVFDRITEGYCVVSPMWYFEISNALSLAQHHRRIASGYRETCFSKLNGMDIRMDEDALRNSWTVTTRLADKFKLTVYDASHLEIANRQSLPLASLDKALRAAAATLNIPLLGL